MATQAISTRIGNREFERIESFGTLVANRVFAEQPHKSQFTISPAPLEQLMKRFGIAVTTTHEDARLSPLIELGLEGLATKHDQPENAETDSGWFSSDYKVEVFSKGFRSRFTLAHELAHVVFSKEYHDLEKSLSGEQTERVCDFAAAMMLCPEQALVEYFRKCSIVTISRIELLAARMQVSISLLLNRLRHLISRDAISIDNIVLLVSLNRSRKRRENLAPRVSAACSAKHWFIPVNSRLSTFGLTKLKDAFYTAPLYFSGRTHEALRIWDYEHGRRVMIECDVTYKCYSWLQRGQSDKTSNAGRVMLAVASRDEDLIR